MIRDILCYRCIIRERIYLRYNIDVVLWCKKYCWLFLSSRDRTPARRNPHYLWGRLQWDKVWCWAKDRLSHWSPSRICEISVPGERPRQPDQWLSCPVPQRQEGRIRSRLTTLTFTNLPWYIGLDERRPRGKKLLQLQIKTLTLCGGHQNVYF
jgi:hypothetical protein